MMDLILGVPENAINLSRARNILYMKGRNNLCAAGLHLGFTMFIRREILPR